MLENARRGWDEKTNYVTCALATAAVAARKRAEYIILSVSKMK